MTSWRYDKRTIDFYATAIVSYLVGYGREEAILFLCCLSGWFLWWEPLCGFEPLSDPEHSTPLAWKLGGNPSASRHRLASSPSSSVSMDVCITPIVAADPRPCSWQLGQLLNIPTRLHQNNIPAWVDQRHTQQIVRSFHAAVITALVQNFLVVKGATSITAKLNSW